MKELGDISIGKNYFEKFLEHVADVTVFQDKYLSHIDKQKMLFVFCCYLIPLGMEYYIQDLKVEGNSVATVERHSTHPAFCGVA
ncbi:hypothetical protein [Wolbachia endosymbiont of Pentidionis agamae]|uniref:hypothetical protein n=1 Tax=Wolbachia endosymbiont of Pentidionis agamae TaxID=3110435 RepID=UPI002FD6C53E